MEKQKKLCKRSICLCQHNGKGYCFLILETVADSVVVVRVSMQEDNKQVDFVCQNQKTGNKQGYKLEDKVGILNKNGLTSTNYNLNPIYFSEISSKYKNQVRKILLDILHKLEYKEKFSILIKEKRYLQCEIDWLNSILFHIKLSPRKKRRKIKYYKLAPNISFSSSSHGFRVAPNITGIKIYHGGRGG